MKLFFVSGEASGDQHASKVIEYIHHNAPEIELVAWGGDLSKQAGARLLSHYKDRAYMGLIEVIKNIRTIKGFMNQAKRDILNEKPDAIVFIDNPGFNLPLAKFAKSLGIPVHWYIAPKAWAWNKKRVKTMRQCIDHLYVIFPFEVAFFEGLNMPCTYVGNPTFESVQAYLKAHPNPSQQTPTIAILAGSRMNEVANLLPDFIRTAQQFPQYQAVIAGAPGLNESFYQTLLKEHGLTAKVEFNKTFDILKQAADTKGLAIVASGTATLETALFKVPQIVAYKVNSLTYFVGKQVLKISAVSLVNILLKTNLLEEHLQDTRVPTLTKAIQRLLQPETLQTVTEGYQTLWNNLEGNPTRYPSKEVGQAIINSLT